MVLESSDARTFYDRFGKRQDTQRFYEDPALDDLIAHAHFDEAGKIFEFGCGTGRFAARLVSEQLASSATYLGWDLSSTMVRLATERLVALAEHARVLHCDGTVRFPVPNNSVDRVVSTYVLDLLSEMDIGKFLQEAYRVLDVGGKLCLVSLTRQGPRYSRGSCPPYGPRFIARAPPWSADAARFVCGNMSIPPTGNWNIETWSSPTAYHQKC